MSAPVFDHITLIGIGLIGSSLAHAIRRHRLARHITGYDSNPAVRERITALNLVDTLAGDAGQAVRGADLTILCVPVGANSAIGSEIASALRNGSILSDVGSVKQAVIRDLGPLLPEGVHFVPAHPIAGTEHSGPDAGFADLFQGRWCILTPPPGANEQAVAKMMQLWQGVGSQVEIMDAGHHDSVLAITSHLPHLIAYTIVGTAMGLETSAEKEVIKFSASGFRDFTRIAASDPVMWRDIFLNNKEAVLEMLGRFTEDLTALQRAIRWGEGDTLQELFTRTRRIRREIIDNRQA